MNIIKRIRKYVSEESYYIGFLFSDEINKSESDRFNSIHWLNLNGHKKGWFADPFFLSVSDKHIELFVEEWEYSKQKGRLCILDIKRKGCEFTLENVTPILELDTHLSFPITIEHNDKTYVYPENYQSGCLKIYEYDRINRKLINCKTLIEHPLLDTQILVNNGKYYAFGVEYITGKQSDTKTLCVFKSDSLFGPYDIIKKIENQYCEERGAGEIIVKNNEIIRPSQSCEIDYGRSVILKKLTIEDNDEIKQSEIERIVPLYNKKYGRGLHTYNMKSNLYVIDGRDYRYRTFSKVIRFIFRKQSFRKIR